MNSQLRFGPRRRGVIVKAKLREAFGRVGQPLLPYSWVGLQPLASFIHRLGLTGQLPFFAIQKSVPFFTVIWPLKQLQNGSVRSVRFRITNLETLAGGFSPVEDPIICRGI